MHHYIFIAQAIMRNDPRFLRQSVEVEYRALLEQESEWTSPSDLDSFLRDVGYFVIPKKTSRFVKTLHTFSSVVGV